MPVHILRKKHTKHLHKRLHTQIRIFFAISVILLLIVVYDVFTNNVSLSLALLGLGAGLILGVVTARMYLLTWDKDAKKVISRLDWIGGIILALYVLSAFLRNKLIGQYVPHPYVTGTSLSLAAGLMFGRVFGTGHKAAKILKEEGIID